jgi:hypothetical protein
MKALEFKARKFSVSEVETIREVVASCPGLSRQELANTVCELLGWRRANGRLKTWEAKQLLERLEVEQEIGLPVLRQTKPSGGGTRIPDLPLESEPLDGSLREVAPVRLRRVEKPTDHERFRQLLGQYHYLGYRMAFGAQLRYLIEVSRPERRVVGCIQLSSPAWKMGVRDRWIGWDQEARRRHLQQVVNQSRFLIVPWVRVRNLASHVLSRMVVEFPPLWQQCYGIRPLLVETLVDGQRYRGTCYEAANWRYLGQTQGRGRQDRHHQRHGACPKKVFVYPLLSGARAALRAEAGR